MEMIGNNVLNNDIIVFLFFNLKRLYFQDRNLFYSRVNAFLSEFINVDSVPMHFNFYFKLFQVQLTHE